jgi:hypothetical protein
MNLQEGCERPGIGGGINRPQQVVERVVTRHREPPALLVPHAEPHGLPLALGETDHFSPDVQHVARAHEQSQGDQPEHGGQWVAAAGGAARVGHFPKGLPQTLELADFEWAARPTPLALGSLAGLRQLPRAHQRARVGRQFFKPELLGPPMGNVKVRVVLRVAFGQPGLHPVGRLVNGARVTLRVAEAFGQQRPITVLAFPLAH